MEKKFAFAVLAITILFVTTVFTLSGSAVQNVLPGWMKSMDSMHQQMVVGITGNQLRQQMDEMHGQRTENHQFMKDMGKMHSDCLSSVHSHASSSMESHMESMGSGMDSHMAFHN